MLTYKDILNNKVIKTEYQKIDNINPFPFNHGLQHIHNVCGIMDKLTKTLGITGEEKDALMIACTLHDVGQATGRDEHGLKARKIAQELFDEELKNNKYYGDILDAIEHHDEKCSTKFSLFTILVQFADKMDFTKRRLEPEYRKKFKYYIYEDLNDIDFIYNDKNFGINILANGIANVVSEFYAQSFTTKIINAVKVLAEKLKLKPIIEINDKEISLNNYIILHGSFGSPEGNWFPYLRKKITQKGFRVETPQMPVGVGIQNYQNWEKEFAKLQIDESTTIFAHSIAPVFVCKFLINNKIKVKRLVFVCGFNNYLGINDEYDNVNKSMYLDNLADIKKYCNDIICFYSDNDPYVKYEVEKDFADTIADKQIVIKKGGHLNSESGYTEFNELLEYI